MIECQFPGDQDSLQANPAKKSTGNSVEEYPGINHCRCLTKLVLHMSEKKFLSTEGEYTRKEYAEKFLESTWD